MRWSDVGKLDCTIARTLSVIGDRWTLLILRDAFLGTRRFEYRLTEKGIELYGVIVMIAGWGDRHMAGRKGPPVERVHRGCGHVTALRLTCDHCGDVVTARDMTARPAKGHRAVRSAAATEERA